MAALSITLLSAGVSDPFHMALAANLISKQDAHSIGVRPTCISIFLLATDITRQQLSNVAADKEAN